MIILQLGVYETNMMGLHMFHSDVCLSVTESQENPSFYVLFICVSTIKSIMVFIVW